MRPFGPDTPNLKLCIAAVCCCNFTHKLHNLPFPGLSRVMQGPPADEIMAELPLMRLSSGTKLITQLDFGSEAGHNKLSLNKYGFPNPVFPQLPPAAIGPDPIVPAGPHNTNTLTETSMCLRHEHDIHIPASIFFTNDHIRYSSHEHVLEPAARSISGTKRDVRALVSHSWMQLAGVRHLSNLRKPMSAKSSEDIVCV